VLRSFVRVGPLAKGLLLHGDLHIHLVALCAEKPTRTLLDTIVDRLTKQLQVKYLHNALFFNLKELTFVLGSFETIILIYVLIIVADSSDPLENGTIKQYLGPHSSSPYIHQSSCVQRYRPGLVVLLRATHLSMITSITSGSMRHCRVV
jgi:DZF domain